MIDNIFLSKFLEKKILLEITRNQFTDVPTFLRYFTLLYIKTKIN